MKELTLLFGIGSIFYVQTQFRNYTSQYRQRISDQTAGLTEQIQSNPDVNLFFYPGRADVYASNYVFDFPLSSNYRIGILIDPCRYNSYDCCMNVFGTAEYPALLKSALEQERVLKYDVLASETAVATTYQLVYEDGSNVATSAQRSADDSAIFNTSCVSLDNPDNSCQGRDFQYQRSSFRAPCMDNNSSLNVTAGCYFPNGTYSTQCVQVGYTSNAFIPQCGLDSSDHCGTYLEVHIAHGTPYFGENTVLAQTQITTRNVSGYYTTVLPLNYMNNNSLILCSYTESQLRVGSTVYVNPTAPTCCCATPFKTTTRVGSFLCPKGPDGTAQSGAFGRRTETIADLLNLDSLLLDYPYCPIDLSADQDRIMCSVYDTPGQRYYTRNCTNLELYGSVYKSSDIGDYEFSGVCPYYENCGLANSGSCNANLYTFTFVGSVGIVTALDNSAVIPQVWITFNNNRTSYKFDQRDVKLETNTKSMYEIWWVIRSLSEFTVQKRKGFNITTPQCTFDSTNNRYFPFAILGPGGTPLDNSLTP